LWGSVVLIVLSFGFRRFFVGFGEVGEFMLIWRYQTNEKNGYNLRNFPKFKQNFPF
jgi:hypothetical protein